MHKPWKVGILSVSNNTENILAAYKYMTQVKVIYLFVSNTTENILSMSNNTENILSVSNPYTNGTTLPVSKLKQGGAL